TPEEERVLEEEFPQMEKISIDFGVLEKIDEAVVIPVSFPWDDLGTWTALERALPLDEDGNMLRGRHIGLETRDCIIYAEDQLIATMGVSNLVIVQANNKILVTTKEHAADLKRLVNKMAKE
ncbi:TPA: mannose-1-phosphate guanylyltransferase, partial [bacterium]|nr:mannose-1-phosphate guanylyltransferase [bacterium]